MKQITYLIPVYNKETVIEDTTNKIFARFDNSEFNLNVIFVENESKDNSLQILNNLSKNNNRVKVLKSKKGFGNAISTGFDYVLKNFPEYSDFLIITGADLPFAFSDIEYVINKHKNLYQDLYIGSKMHNQSSIKRTLSRTFISKIFNIILFIFFKIDIKDTQGSIIFNLNKTNIELLKPISSGFFSSAEVCIKANYYGYTIREIPIKFYESSKDVSTVKIFSDSYHIFKEIVKFKIFFKNKIL